MSKLPEGWFAYVELCRLAVAALDVQDRKNSFLNFVGNKFSRLKNFIKKINKIETNGRRSKKLNNLVAPEKMCVANKLNCCCFLFCFFVLFLLRIFFYF